MKYPTVGEVMSACVDDLAVWHENLPPPQTDVERTVHRRVQKRGFELAAKKIRNDEPELANEWNDLMDKIEGIGVRGTTRM